MTNYAKRVFRGTLLVFLASILSGFVTYLTRVVLARTLTVYEYGLLFAVLNFVLLFDILRDLGLGNALVRYIPQFIPKKRFDKIKASIIYVFSLQFISALIFVTIIFFLSNWLSQSFFKSPDSLLILRMFLLMFLFSIITYNLRSVFWGFQSMNNYAIIEFLRKFLALLFVLIFFKLGFGIMGAVYAEVLVFVVIPFIMFPILLKKFNFFKYKPKFSKVLFKDLVFFGLPTVLAYLGASFIGSIDTVFITYFRNLEEVALYNVAMPIAMFLYYLGNSLLVVIFPIVSELWAKKQKSKIASGITLLQKYALIIIIPAVFVLIPFSKLLINIFFGAQYEPAAIALQILVIGISLYVMADLNMFVLSGIGKPKIAAKIIIIIAIINTLMNFMLVPVYGYVGAAITTSLSYACALFMSIKNLKKFIPVHFPWAIFIKISVCGAISIGIIYLMKEILIVNVFMEMALCLIVASISYIFLLFFLKAISLGEINDLKKSIFK